MSRATKMNRITSPELLAQVNPLNKEILSDFLDYLRSTQRSETTIFGYKNDIEIAWVWCLQNNNNLFFVDWSKRHIVKYQNWLIHENGNSPARVKRLKAALSSLGNYIENVWDDEYPDYRNIVNKIESPLNQPVREKTIFTEEELENLLNTLIEKSQYDKACLLALAIYSGRRKAELIRFKVSDFSNDKLICDGALYKSSPIKTKGRSGGKYIPCYTLAKKFNPYLKQWLSYREDNGIQSEWLFPSKRQPDAPMNITTLNSWAKTFSDMTGRDFYFHCLRHFYTSYLARAGIPDSVIAEIVGWSDVGLVSVYNDNSKDDQIGMYFKNGEIDTSGKKSIDQI